jgi:hypothetical protein
MFISWLVVMVPPWIHHRLWQVRYLEITVGLVRLFADGDRCIGEYPYDRWKIGPIYNPESVLFQISGRKSFELDIPFWLIDKRDRADFRRRWGLHSP